MRLVDNIYALIILFLFLCLSYSTCQWKTCERKQTMKQEPKTIVKTITKIDTVYVYLKGTQKRTIAKKPEIKSLVNDCPDIKINDFNTHYGDSSVSIVVNSTALGELLSQQVSWDVKCPETISRIDSVFIKEKYPEKKWGMYGGVYGNMNMFAPTLIVTTRNQSYQISYDIMTPKPTLYFGWQIRIK